MTLGSDIPDQNEANTPLSVAAAATTGGSLLQGFSWKMASTYVPQAYILAVSIAAARFLGPNDLGIQSFIAFTEFSVIMAVSAGFSRALMRNIGEALGADQADQLRYLVRWAWIVLGTAGLLGGASLVVVGAAGASPGFAWTFAGIAAALGIMHTVPSAVLIGAQRWRDASIVGLATGAIGTVGVIAVLAAGGRITAMFCVEAAISTINLLWTTALASRATSRYPLAPARDNRFKRQVLDYASLATVASIVDFIVWRRSEFYFLEHYSTNDQIAFYSIAFAAATALIALPRAVGEIVAPAAATLTGAGGSERLASGYGRAVRLTLAASLPLTAAALALGPAVLEMIYGSDYRQARSVLVVLVLPLPVIVLFTIGSAFLIGLGLIRVQLLITACCALLNIGLDFFFIPRYGALGAASANTLAQVAASVPTFVYASRCLKRVQWSVRSLAHMATASAAAGVAAFAVVTSLGALLGVALGLSVGLMTFAILAGTLGVLAAEDAAWLDKAAGHRFGGLIGQATRLCSLRPASDAS